MNKSNTCLIATLLCPIPENDYGRPFEKNNGKWTGSWLPVIVKSTDIFLEGHIALKP